MIELPFPPSHLSPNARVHWAVKAKAVKQYKLICGALLSVRRAALKGRSQFAIVFHPPSARRYDTDGLIARFKPGQDALSAITGVDDVHFVMTYRRGEPIKDGKVVIA